MPKTAGTSVESFFLKHYGAIPAHRESPIKNLSRRYKEFYKLGLTISPFPHEGQHITPEYAEQKDFYSDVNYSFAFVRNPWDRLVSELLWRNKFYNKTTDLLTMFDEYQSQNSAHYFPQYKFIYIDKRKVVDDVFKFEEIDKAEAILSSKFGFNVKLPVLNKSHNRLHYTSYIDYKTMKKFKPLLTRDCEIFDYGF